ncbi:MAG: tetraacyldisaccharide 4'-kinase [Candidatus Omnitrophota bacterium]
MKKLVYNLAMDTSAGRKTCRGEDKFKGFIPGVLKIILFFLSLIYGVVIRILMFVCYWRQWRIGCRVISVGNITVGGTGKTPLVEYIARYLKEQGHKTAVISRGYNPGICNRKRHSTPNKDASSSEKSAYILQSMLALFSVKSASFFVVSVLRFYCKIRDKRKSANPVTRIPSPETMGDEPYMLEQSLKNVPVIVDTNRMRGINSALDEYGVDTVILDDGFQQWKIKKDLEIVAIDVSNPFGNRKMLPRGILRQPLSSLSKADVFVLTKVNINPDFDALKDFLGQINPKAIIVEAIHKPVGIYRLDMKNDPLDMAKLKGEKAALFSGIADPVSFEKIVMSLGIEVDLTFCFTDHYVYLDKDIEDIIRQSKDKGIDMIITTEKDAVKLSRIPYPVSRIPILVLRIELEITDNEERLHERLLKLSNP